MTPILRKRSSRGFTLVEIMVAAALLIVMIGATFGALIATNNSSQRIYRIAVTQEIARQGLDILAADIREAGLGIAGGSVNAAPNFGLPTGVQIQIPVIYSGPNITVTQPNQTSSIVTNSIFILSAEASTVGMPADTTAVPGIQGEVVAVTGASPPLLQVACAQLNGSLVNCDGSASPIIIGSSPLLIGDLRHAAVVTPTLVTSGASGTELVTTQEAQSGGLPQVDPKSPYGIPSGAILSRLRVVHWYLKQTDPSAPPRLYRSTPVLGAKGSSSANLATLGAFSDETTDPVNGVQGKEMGAGPIQSLQIRYILDPYATNQFSQFQIANSISPVGTADIASNIVPQAVSTLREVRIEIVSLADQPDLATNLGQLQIGYTTPGFEGTSPTAGTGGGAGGGSGGGSGGGTAAVVPTDPYPRRAFTVRVTPRALQGARL